MKRALAAAAVVVLLLLGAAAGYVLYRKHQQRNVHGSSTVEFVPTTKAVVPPPEPAIPWPLYGRDELRTRAVDGLDVKPPFDLLWTFHAQTLVEFPPAVAYKRLYFANNAGVMFAISARTGLRAWRRVTGRCVAASPAVQDGMVFMTFLNKPPCNASGVTDGELVAYSPGTGTVIWRQRIGPSESSPLLADGLVVIGDWAGDVMAFRARTGKPVWRFHTGGRVKGGAATDGTRVYIGSYDGRLYALDLHAGRKLWQASAQGSFLGNATFYATPSVGYGRVYVGATDGKMYSFGAESGKLRWSHDTGGYVYSSAALWRGIVFAGSYGGTFYAFDAATGDVRWKFDAGGQISGSPTVVDGIVYFATLKEKTFGLDARTGRVVWSFPDGKYSPVVADGRRLYLVGYARVFGFLPHGSPSLVLTAREVRAALGPGRFRLFPSGAAAKHAVRPLHGGRICNVVVLGKQTRKGIERLRAACAG